MRARHYALIFVIAVGAAVAGCAGESPQALPVRSAQTLATMTALPACVNTAPDGPQPWPTPHWKSTDPSVDASLEVNAPVMNLAVADSNLGHNQAIQIETLPLESLGGPGGSTAGPGGGTVPDAQADVSSNSITLWSGIVNYNIDFRRATLAQTLFREYDVVYYSTSGALPAPTSGPGAGNGTVAAVVNGTTYFWTLTTAKGYLGYEYLLADDDLKTNFGEDDAFAVYDALVRANNPPATFTDADKNPGPYVDQHEKFLQPRPAPANTGQICKS